MIQEKKHKKKSKKPSAMAQVHNRVNAGIMDAVTCGGMCEAAEPEDEEYVIGMEEEGGPSNYGHVVNESSDVVPYFNLDLQQADAYPFITLKKKDGSDTDTFVGPEGGEHNTMPAVLLSNGNISKDDFDSLWDIRRNEYKSGRIWFNVRRGQYTVVSFYSYHRDNYQRMYHDIVNTLLSVEEKLGKEFNIGKVLVDFWTFPMGHDDVFIPVRWLNNGVADAYFKYMKKCTPIGSDVFRMETSRGDFDLDWNGEEGDIMEGRKKNIKNRLVNEACDTIPCFEINLYDDDAFPFITFIKKGGSNSDTYVGDAGTEHFELEDKLLDSGRIKETDYEKSYGCLSVNEYRTGRIWFKGDYIAVTFYSYRNDWKQIYFDIVHTLGKVREKLGVDFNIGKVMVKFWTFNENVPVIPVRWFNPESGIPEAYFKYMVKCAPIGNDCFKMETKKGTYIMNWRGEEVEPAHSMLSEGKEVIKISESDLKRIINEIVKKIVVT